jgi:hypothetical protein
VTGAATVTSTTLGSTGRMLSASRSGTVCRPSLRCMQSTCTSQGFATHLSLSLSLSCPSLSRECTAAYLHHTPLNSVPIRTKGVSSTFSSQPALPPFQLQLPLGLTMVDHTAARAEREEQREQRKAQRQSSAAPAAQTSPPDELSVLDSDEEQPRPARQPTPHPHPTQPMSPCAEGVHPPSSSQADGAGETLMHTA